MQIKAEQKYLRISPRKIRLISDAIKNLKIDQALAKLKLLNKTGALELAKVLKQAEANAKQVNADINKLNIKEILVNPGPIYKRGRPVSRGMWHPIKKRTSHIRVILEDKNPE